MKGAYSLHDFARSARFHGVPFRMPSRFPIPAQAPSRVVLSLREGDPALAGRVARALYRAYFVDDQDISDPDVAAVVAGRAGADPTAARAAVDDPTVKDALKREVAQAIGAGVFGSPFVIVEGECFWGVDRFPQVERWLATGGF